MYFKIFKPISWGKRPAERRSRLIQRFLRVLLSVEGLAVGALLHGRIGLVRADLNAVQRAIVLGAAVMLALRDRASDAMVRVAVHVSDLLF